MENELSSVSSTDRVADPLEPESAGRATFPSMFERSVVLWPGIVLVGVVVGAAYSLREFPGLAIFSPMILAVIIGMVFANVVGVAPNTKAGIGFSQKGLLRFAIVLLGFQLTIGQVLSIGAGGFGIVALTLAATFLFTITLARFLGVERRLAELIAAGTSICGASAIVATNAVTSARDEDVAYAVACITLFGTIAMLGYPLLAPTLGLDQHHFGLWAGASIHEVAQVIGAAFQNGPEAGEIGTVAKLTRVALLAPMVIALGLVVRRGGGQDAASRPPLPLFVVGFVAVVVFNSFVGIPDAVRPSVSFVTTLMLSMGLAAMGLHTNVSEIRSRGLRPLILALSAFVFIAVFSLMLVKLAG
jgi:uncharacterized integral membrane protein (TIGR00698 family)